jgi:hypothetical protein
MAFYVYCEHPLSLHQNCRVDIYKISYDNLTIIFKNFKALTK